MSAEHHSGTDAASGATKGPLYQQFSAEDDLLAAMWLRSVSMWLRAVRRSQDRFLRQLTASRDVVEAAIAAGLAIHDFAIQEPANARLLAALRREDLARQVGDPALASELQKVNDQLQAAVTALARNLYGRATHDTVQRTTCAVIDLPMGALRRHLVSDVAIPASVRPQLTAAIRAALHDRTVGRT